MVETSSKTHPQVGFLSLADELIINILTRLDLRTLVRCHRVCSVLHSIIQSAVDLQYKINLDMVGMQDVPANNGVGIVDRLKMLKDHSRAWKEGNPTETVLDGQMADERYYTCGGVLGYVNIDRDMRESLSLIQIPSRSRGIPERRWTLKDIGSIHEVALDPSQNLLVVVSDDEDADPQGGWSSQLQILDLKTGETHRLAQQRVLRYASHIISDELGSTTDVAICGRFLAISYSRFQTSVGDLDGDRVDTIVVLDWMTGDTHLVRLSTVVLVQLPMICIASVSTEKMTGKLPTTFF
ncbi:hypothetical protein JAAARDRAFT_284422 [Jaapia argillacea MUCL 33604]|uniref:F-box domain-containing protein n=1 Tax=Jaapia argillacea MUCL 33604 TaxID=933084 RepID=A0A067PQT2_9AGAM|nr:hypothetical protein JAAARDRAFT_284422 [Jaapia argillacea MUCL 33604]